MSHLIVRTDKLGTNNLTNLCVGAPIADKIGLKLGHLLGTTGLWTFGLPYKIPGLEPKKKLGRIRFPKFYHHFPNVSSN